MENAISNEEQPEKPAKGATVPMVNSGFTKVDSGSTRVSEAVCDNEMDFVPEQVDFTGVNKRHFIVDFSREIGRGGEAIVVAAVDDDGNEHVAKVYNIPQGRREQRNHNAVLEFLAMKSQEAKEGYKSTHLMPLLEYGVISAMLIGDDRVREFNVSIMPKCECLGDSVLSKKDIKTRIIPSIADALKTLHDANIVHRDVKPSNIFEYNGIVVLGDYGISTIVDKDSSLKDTHSNRGTAGYWLPVGYVEPRGDWYSLGYTIWTMYNNNVHPHQERIDAGNLLADVYAGRRVVPFVPASEEDESLRDLVYGLTTVHADRRLGYDDVQRWIHNPDDFEFDDPGSEEADGWRHKYEFADVKYDTGPKLAEALSKNWDYAMQHLFDGNDLVGHFSKNGESDKSTKLRIIVRDYAGSKQDLGLAKAIYIISGSDERMVWKEKDISFPSVVLDFSSKPIDSLGFYDEVFSSRFLSWAIREGGLEDVGIDNETLQLIEDVSESNPRFARCLFQCLFADGGMSEYAGYKEPSGFVESLLAQPQSFYCIAKDKTQYEPCVAALAPFFVDAGKELKTLVSTDNFKDGDTLFNATRLLMLLDEVDGGNTVSEFAIEYGPAAPWIWVGRNISEYESLPSGCSEVVEEAMNAFSEFSITGYSSVDDVARLGQEAQFQAERIRQEMNRSPVPQYLGIDTGKTLVARCDDALFCSSFYGDVVPRGFVRNLAVADGTDLSIWPEVSLLSEEIQTDRSYVETATASCDEGILKCEEAKEASGSRIVAISRLLLDVCVVFGLILVAPSFSGILSLICASFLGIFEGTIEQGQLFTQFAIALLCFFFAYDGVVSFWVAKGASIIDTSLKDIRMVKDKVEKAADAFASGNGEYAEGLLDSSKNNSHTSFALTESVRDAVSRASSVAVQGKSYLYVAIWHTVAIVGVAYCVVAALVFLIPPLDINPWITIVLVLIGVAIVYGLACWGLGKPGSQMYTGYGMIGMLAAQLCTVGIVSLLIVVVMVLIAVAVAIGALVLAIAIGVGLLSS